MNIDVKKYMPHTDAFDMPREKKVELITIIYSMMESVIDEAFSTHPVQLAQEDSEENCLQDDQQTIDSIENSTLQVFNDCADAANEERNIDGTGT